MERVETGDRVPEEYVAQVRDALVHLYDYAHLERHPLVATLSSVDIAVGAGRALRNRVLDAIEELHPDESVARGTRAWRPYDILTQRYVDGFVVDDILESLHISLRQFQREQRRALLAVASILWRRQLAADADADPANRLARAGAPNSAVSQLAVEVERMGLKLEAIEVAALIEDALAPVMPFARQNQAQVVVEDSAPVVALADRALVRQALVAALSATVASGPGTIGVSWRRLAQGVAIEIEADVPSARRDRVRDRLRGIHDLLHGQGGRLMIDDSAADAWLLSVHLRAATGIPVLVVDDDRRLRQLFSRYLESEGFRFRGAGSAQEALRYLEGAAPEVIIMDVMMRDMDGWQLLQLLRSRQELDKIPIIVCSVLNEPGLAVALGAQTFLSKPVGPQELLAAVHEVLGMTRQAGQG